MKKLLFEKNGQNFSSLVAVGIVFSAKLCVIEKIF